MTSSARWHPSGIDQRIVDKVLARRGRLHRYESLAARDTLLVVIDVDTRTVEMDPRLLGIAAPIRRVAQALRAGGGRVAWVTTPIDGENVGRFRELLGDDMVRQITGTEDLDALEDADLSEWPSRHLPIDAGFDVRPEDVQAVKNLYSAFAPSQSDLVHLILDDRRAMPETVLFAGTVTNVCVESSVRDAVELGLKAIVISDAVVGHSFGAHEASLAAMYRNFADVRPKDEVVELIRHPEGESDSLNTDEKRCEVCGYLLSDMVLEPHVVSAAFILGGGQLPIGAPSPVDAKAILKAHGYPGRPEDRHVEICRLLGVGHPEGESE